MPNGDEWSKWNYWKRGKSWKELQDGWQKLNEYKIMYPLLCVKWSV